MCCRRKWRFRSPWLVK